ncbi:hypothetical protein MTO96_039337 [Rhipicephalus appendiculatus]
MRRCPSANLSTWRCLNNAATTPRLCRGHLSRQINQRTAHPPFRRSKLTFFNSSRAGVAAERTQEERLRPELLSTIQSRETLAFSLQTLHRRLLHQSPSGRQNQRSG